MRIPSRFNLLGREIQVVFDNKTCGDRKCLGSAYLDFDKILLADEKEGIKLPSSLIEHTFVHEALHHFLNALGEDKLGDNEKFVDILSGMIHQMLTTSKYDESQD